MEGSGVLCGDMIVVVKNCTWKDGKKLGILKHEVGGIEFVLLLLTKLFGLFFFFFGWF